MTDIKEKQNHFSKLKCIAISWHFNKPTGKEHLLLFVAIVAWIFPGLVFFKHSLWGGLLFFFFVAGSYAFLAFPHFTHRKKIWKERLDQSLKEYQPLDLQAWAYFKDRVREEGMTYKACESWMSTEAREGANKRGNSSRLTQSFHFFMFEPIFSPVNALNQPI